MKLKIRIDSNTPRLEVEDESELSSDSNPTRECANFSDEEVHRRVSSNNEGMS